MNRFLLIAFALVTLAAPAPAAPLVSDVSQYRIDMDANFSGSRMFLFGARNDNGDVVVVIRGPAKNYIVRKKEEIGGIWVNRGRMKFRDIPSFYAMAASRPLAEIGQESLLNQMKIGESHLIPVMENAEPYAQAFLDYQHANRLYTPQAGELQFMGETLFKTTVEFPDNIPPGNYTAEIYLVSDGDIVGMQAIPIKVSKTGLDAFLYGYAHNHPALYGLSAVVLALAIGWFAGRIFERR